MKILHFLPWYSPHIKGGTEIFLLTLAKFQIMQGHDVEIICPNIKQTTETDSIDTIKITCFAYPYGTKDAEILYSIKEHSSIEVFENTLNAIKPDIIHIHGFHSIFIGYFQKLKNKYVLLLTPHLIDVVCPKHTLVNYKNEFCDGLVELKRCTNCVTFSRYQNVNKNILRMKANAEQLAVNSIRSIYQYNYFSIAKNVISKINSVLYFKENMFVDALSPWFYDVLKMNGIEEKRLTLFKNPILEIKNYKTSVIEKRNEPLKFLFAGRLSVEKGVQMLIDALELLSDYKLNFRFELIGKMQSETLQSKLDDLIKQGYPIEILGEIDPSEMTKYYRSNDYLVFSSQVEMLPLVVLEALQNDLPVISSNIPACRNIIWDNVNGFLFKSDSACDLAKVLRNVIEMPTQLKFEFDCKKDIYQSKMNYYENLYKELIQ